MQVSKSDAGSYRCRAENGVEPAVETHFELHVSGREMISLGSYELVLPATGPSTWSSVEMRRFLEL